MITALLQQWRAARRRRLTCHLLLGLDDRMLADVGQNRAELEQELRRPLLGKGRQPGTKYRLASYLERPN